MTVAFILGAGFSKGYNPSLVPLINDFLDVAEKNGILKPDDEHKELINFIKKYFGEYRNVNIETLASFLTTDLTPDISQKYEYREKLYKQLHRIIIRTLGRLHDKPRDQRIKKIYQDFAYKLIENEIDVITFNYDLILDNLLLNTEKWSPNSGYGVKIKVAGVPNNLVENIIEKRKIKSEMGYLKLHGSLNWGRRILPHPYRGDEILINPFGSFELDQPISPIEGVTSASGSPFTNIFYESFFIPPILTKQHFYKIPLLQNIWYIAKEVLAGANEIYVLGYSFPPSDFTAEFLFRQFLATPFSAPNKKIKIVNKQINNEYKTRIESILQKCEFEYLQEDVVQFLDTYVKK